tara:strand:+ start:253 stop:483 length:231 start_codon:yes stop_codon:yes gene_type:complete
MEFSKKGRSIIIYKDIGESDQMFFERGNFIISQDEINNLNFLEKMSKIYCNIKYKRCVYSNNINKIIKSMEAKILS